VALRVVVTSEYRFSRTPDGAVWTQDGPDHGFWTRYLAAFDEVRLVARIQDVASVAPDARRVDGPQITPWAVPYYLGPSQYLRRRAAIGRAVSGAASASDAVILRVPSPIGAILATARHRQRRPYALEVIGDPYDVLAPGVVRHGLRPLLRTWSTAALRQQCRRATAVAYVTERSLQARYPARPGARTTVYSSVDLPASGSRRRRRWSRSARWRSSTRASTPCWRPSPGSTRWASGRA
jgi:hypothetical protein